MVQNYPQPNDKGCEWSLGVVRVGGCLARAFHLSSEIVLRVEKLYTFYEALDTVDGRLFFSGIFSAEALMINFRRF